MDTNYMLELDVPEGYILNMKDMDRPYIKYSDGMPKKLSRWQKVQYEEVINEDLVVKTGFGKYVSLNNLNIEALLPYIKKEWVILLEFFCITGIPNRLTTNFWHNRGDLSATSSQNNAFYLICLIGLHIYPIISPY